MKLGRGEALCYPESRGSKVVCKNRSSGRPESEATVLAPGGGGGRGGGEGGYVHVHVAGHTGTCACTWLQSVVPQRIAWHQLFNTMQGLF